MQLDATMIRGTHVELEPLSQRHREELREAMDCDEEQWKLLRRCGIGEGFEEYWRDLMSGRKGQRKAFAIRHLASGAIAGTSSFLRADPANRTLEIGATWLRPDDRGTQVNLETKLLMLSRAFDAGAQRVQFTADARNGRSRGALEKLGARQEGVIRSNLVTWTGHRRDTVIFSILAAEWPRLRARLQKRLAFHPGQPDPAPVAQCAGADPEQSEPDPPSERPRLHGKRLRVVASVTNSLVSAETVLALEENGAHFSGSYRGGAILDGYLIGRFVEGSVGEVMFRYVQADADGKVDAGMSIGRFARLADDRLRLTEGFEWSTRAGNGRNIFEEIEGGESGVGRP